MIIGKHATTAIVTTLALGASLTHAFTLNSSPLLPQTTTTTTTYTSTPSSSAPMRSRTHHLPMSEMTEDFPSDSSTEDYVDVESTNIEPTPSETIVSSILDDLLPANSGPMVPVSSETRASINEALLKLEALNPALDEDAQPVLDNPLLNGVWSLRYAGGYSEDWALNSPTRQLALFLYSGGYSPGLFALSLAQKLPSTFMDVGELEIAISRENPRIEAKVGVEFLGGATNEVVVRASLEGESNLRLKETYEKVTVLGRELELPQAVQYSRDMYVTYLDEDILIVRDASGVPEILVRKS